MPPFLSELEQHRSGLAAQLSQFERSAHRIGYRNRRRCGKPICHCAQADDHGHGPILRLTYKVQGKTISESLPPAAVSKAEREIVKFRKGNFRLIIVYTEFSSGVRRMQLLVGQDTSPDHGRSSAKPCDSLRADGRHRRPGGPGTLSWRHSNRLSVPRTPTSMGLGTSALSQRHQTP